VSKVNINDVQPPEQVLAAFDDAVKASQDREKLRNEGQAYANDVIPKASGLASRLMEEAEGYKQRVVSNAEGDAARFKQVLAEYSKAPGVMRERLYQDMMQQILSNSSKVLVDQKSGSNLLYLPLDKLIQQTHPQQAGAAPQAGAPAANLPPPPTTEPASSAPAGANRSSSRDVVRSREFEER
jgi:membrane protease subunit HflK